MGFKRFLTCVMLVVLVICGMSGPTTAGALTLEEATQKRNELQAELIAINKKLAEIGDDIKRAEAKAQTYGQRKSIVEQQISAIKETIALKEEELQLRQSELDLKIREREETYELFKQRLRYMYMNNDTSELSAVLGASTFSEFLVRAENLRRVSKHDTELIDKLVEEQKVIEEAKNAIEVDLLSLENDQAELDDKYNELAYLYREANDQLTTAEALKDVTESDYAAILESFNQINSEWQALMGTGSVDYVGGYFAWPVPGYQYISSPYGWRTLYGAANWHGGIDIAGSGIYNKPIIASNAGRVAKAAYYTWGYGYHVIIDHGGNNWTVYGHMSSIAVNEGDYVPQGAVIGYVGSTGNSTGPHLHFEIRLNGEKVDPLTVVVR